MLDISELTRYEETFLKHLLLQRLIRRLLMRESLSDFGFTGINANEGDLLVEKGADIDAYEIKSAATISSDFFKGLKVLSNEMDNIERSSIIFNGRMQQFRNKVNILPWRVIAGEF